MIKRIHHIGIAVKNLGLSTEVFSRLFGREPSHVEDVPQQHAGIAFYPLGV